MHPAPRPGRPPGPRRRALLVLALLASGAEGQAPLDVALRDGLLSVRAVAAPATALAEALANETGVRFVVAGDGARPITTEIVEEPLEKAIAKLSPNHLLVRDGEARDAALVEVVLMVDDAAGGGAGASGGGEFLPSGAPAAEIVPDESLMAPAPPPLDAEPAVFVDEPGEVVAVPVGDDEEFRDLPGSIDGRLPPEDTLDAR